MEAFSDLSNAFHSSWPGAEGMPFDNYCMTMTAASTTRGNCLYRADRPLAENESPPQPVITAALRARPGGYPVLTVERLRPLRSGERGEAGEVCALVRPATPSPHGAPDIEASGRAVDLTIFARAYVASGVSGFESSDEVARLFSRSALAAPDQSAFLVYRDQAPVAGVRFVLHGGVTVLNNLWVDPSAQRQGIARRLLESHLHSGRLNGPMALQVDATNAAALRLYEQFGFSFAAAFSYRPARDTPAS